MHNVKYIHSTPDGDDLVAYMARVSNPNNQDNKDTAPRLISYLIKHKHWSPFEMVSMCVEIETTRSIAAQILRHRSFSFQEFSQRYATVTQPGVIPHLRRQDQNNRQNSIDDLDAYTTQRLEIATQKLYNEAFDLYEEMLNSGVAKECARDILPLSSPTKLYMHGTLRSWFHYIDLRSANGTQLEHQQIALSARNLIQTHFPNCYNGLFRDR